MSGNYERMELKVGALVLVCSLLLIAFLVLLGKFRPGQEAMVVVDFETSGGLRIGAPVKLAGIDAGRVELVDFMGGAADEDTQRRVYVRVTVSMKPELRASLREDARFYITTEGLLGEQYVEIDPGRADEVLSNKPVEGISPMRLEILTANMNRIATLAARMLEDNEEDIRDTIRDLRSTAASAKSALDDAKALLTDVRQAVARLETKAGTLMDTAVRTLNEYTPGKGETGDNIKKTTASAANLVTSAERVFADGKLVKDVISDARSALRKAGGLADHIGVEVTKVRKKADATLGSVDVVIAEAKVPAISALQKLDALMSSGKAIGGDIKALLESIRKGEGTVGAVLADRELFDDVRELMKDIRRHPWKVLWKE